MGDRASSPFFVEIILKRVFCLQNYEIFLAY